MAGSDMDWSSVVGSGANGASAPGSDIPDSMRVDIQKDKEVLAIFADWVRTELAKKHLMKVELPHKIVLGISRKVVDALIKKLVPLGLELPKKKPKFRCASADPWEEIHEYYYWHWFSENILGFVLQAMERIPFEDADAEVRKYTATIAVWLFHTVNDTEFADSFVAEMIRYKYFFGMRAIYDSAEEVFDRGSSDRADLALVSRFEGFNEYGTAIYTTWYTNGYGTKLMDALEAR